MLYLIDANVIVDAARDYYSLNRVPQFWEWLLDMGRNGALKIPLEIYQEITPDDDDALVAWLKANRSTMVLDESIDPELLTRVRERYAPDLTDSEIEEIGADPSLIAYALANPSKRCVVTMEASRPRRKRANRHIPDVCDDLGIRWIDTFQLIRDLDFRIR